MQVYSLLLTILYIQIVLFSSMLITRPTSPPFLISLVLNVIQKVLQFYLEMTSHGTSPYQKEA